MRGWEMSESLRNLSTIEYGASPKEIRSNDSTSIGIYGTGGLVGSATKPLFHGPLVVVARKGTLDKPLFITGDCWVIDTAYAVLPNANVDAKWLYYNLLKYDLKKLNESTGVPSISRDYLYRVTFETYPLAEQRKIARILSTVDAVIEKSEAAIAKYKAIKSGMMCDLFTRGIDLKTGKLRPRYEDAPQLYKWSELGWVPMEWVVEPLIKLSKDGLKNGYFKKPEYVGWGYKLINVTDLYQPYEIDLRQKDVQRVFATSSDYGKYEVQVGDLFFTRSSLVLEGIAHCNILLALPEKAVWECHVVRLRPDKQKINPEYLGCYCTTYEARLFFMSIAKQVTMTTISQPDIAKLPVPFPHSIDEQNEIAKRLRALDINIRSEDVVHSKYQQLKAALMSDLLTGKVRVKYNDETAEAQ
jgi:type I restriction enzyme, S subunit